MSPNRVPLPPVAHLGFGQVRHTRLRPSAHAFAYDTFYALLPMRQLAAAQDARAHAQVSAGLAINRRGWLSFHDQDHGDGRGPEAGGALAWLDELLRREGIPDATGEVWLHTYPRVLGYVFKPVSFWYAHDGQGQLRAIVVEVNNTFGERHCYLLETPAWGQSLQARKVFHVSPFCAVEGHYTFRFFYTAQQGIARIEHHDAQGPPVAHQREWRAHTGHVRHAPTGPVELPLAHAGRDRPHPLASLVALAQARSFFPQTRTPQYLRDPLSSGVPPDEYHHRPV